MTRPAPRTLEEFNTPIHRGAWLMTTGGVTYTWEEYEARIRLDGMAMAMTQHDAEVRKAYRNRRGGRP